MSYDLGFISDEDLYNHVKETVDVYRANIGMDLQKFNSNLIDPIKLTFDIGAYGADMENVIKQEISRQISKSNQNQIGYFHQNIFKYIGDDWSVPKQGWDIQNTKSKIYVEMKNKHNTMNSSSSQKTYMRMQNELIKDPKAVCMLVEVIAKNSQNIPWQISLDGAPHSHANIRRVSVDKFYEFVTNDKYAFAKLCAILPRVIGDVLETKEAKIMQNSVFDELQDKSDDMLKSLYLLAFEKYEGFENLKFR